MFYQKLIVSVYQISLQKYKASTTAYYTDSSDELITDILNSFGKAVRVENESELRVAGALAGGVPAILPSC